MATRRQIFMIETKNAAVTCTLFGSSTCCLFNCVEGHKCHAASSETLRERTCSCSWVTVCDYIVAVPGWRIVMSSGNFVSQLGGLLGAPFVDVVPTAFCCTHLTDNVMIRDAFSKILDLGVLLVGPTDFFYSQTTAHCSGGEEHEI